MTHLLGLLLFGLFFTIIPVSADSGILSSDLTSNDKLRVEVFWGFTVGPQTQYPAMEIEVCVSYHARLGLDVNLGPIFWSSFGIVGGYDFGPVDLDLEIFRSGFTPVFNLGGTQGSWSGFALSGTIKFYDDEFFSENLFPAAIKAKYLFLYPDYEMVWSQSPVIPVSISIGTSSIGVAH